jgi:hypothetical protein
MRHYLQNNQSRVDRRHGSSGRAPALQMQSPELKLQSHQKQTKKLRFNKITSTKAKNIRKLITQKNF